MAGRKAHVQSNEGFDQFIQSIPEDARGHGFWRIRMEKMGERGSGVLPVICGFLEFLPSESYDGLRDRVKAQFAETRGPGVYFALPCDQEKKEIKGLDKARFEFKESEVPMPESSAPETNPLGDTLRTVKKMSSDMASLQSMELQQKILNKFLGIDKDKKEDDSVKEPTVTPNTGITDLLLWQNFMGGGGTKKEAAVDPAVAQQLNDLKMERLISERLEKVMGEVKALVQPKQDDKVERLLEKLVEAQAKPKDDDKVEKLFEKMQESQNRVFEKMLELAKPKEDSKVDRLIEQMAVGKQENAFQSMLAMMVKQSEDREKARIEEERRRDKEAAERERLRAEDEKRREEERKEERRRADEDRKEERRRLDEQAKLERQKFEAELREQQRRFDEEAKLRREEMKREDEKSRGYASEQQKYNLELLNIFKNNKDSSLDTTAKIVEVMTTAGVNSMKTSQDAAETIMEIAKSAGLGRGGKDKEKEGDGKGFIDQIKDIAQIAAPLIAPYADADAKMKVLQAASKMSAGAANLAGFGGQKKRPPTPPVSTPSGDGGIAGFSKAEIDAAAAMAAQHGFSRADVENALKAAVQNGMSRADIEAAINQMGGQPAAQPSGAAPAAAAQTTPPVTPSATPQGTATVNATNQDGSKNSNIGGMRGMIAQYLKAYPILKHALIGNLRDKLGVKSFMPVVTGLNQPTLEGLLANVPHQVVMSEIKQVCSDDEAKLVDENEPWFLKFRQEMIEVLKESEEDEDDEEDGGAPEKKPEISAPPIGK